jgi:hypothetical protein
MYPALKNRKEWQESLKQQPLGDYLAELDGWREISSREVEARVDRLEIATRRAGKETLFFLVDSERFRAQRSHNRDQFPALNQATTVKELGGVRHLLRCNINLPKVPNAAKRHENWYNPSAALTPYLRQRSREAMDAGKTKDRDASPVRAKAPKRVESESASPGRVKKAKKPKKAQSDSERASPLPQTQYKPTKAVPLHRASPAKSAQSESDELSGELPSPSASPVRNLAKPMNPQASAAPVQHRQMMVMPRK